jgi:sensor histidine kinase YesM
MKVKSRINIILPIVLSGLLPGLSMYAKPNWGAMDSLNPYWVWFTASILLYIIWHLFWYIWDLTHGYQKWWSLLLPAGAIAVILGIMYLILFRNMEEFEGYNLFRLIPASVLFLVIQYALRTQQEVSRLSLEKEQIKKENYKVQLKALRAQIDPHFLFNSLNTLRSMVRQQHANSEQFVMSLSDFYRHTLRHHEEATLPLSEELVVLQSYLFLMKNRNEEAVSILINIDRDIHERHLPTLALQTVVENCFKHNSMSSKKPLRIEISNTNDDYIAVSNNLQPKIGNEDDSGYGLDLLNKRYELLKRSQGVRIEQTADRFTVKLKLIKP